MDALYDELDGRKRWQERPAEELRQLCDRAKRTAAAGDIFEGMPDRARSAAMVQRLKAYKKAVRSLRRGQGEEQAAHPAKVAFIISPATVLRQLTRTPLDDVDASDAEVPAGRRIVGMAVAAVAIPTMTAVSLLLKAAEPAVTTFTTIKPLRLLFAPVCGHVREGHADERSEFKTTMRECAHAGALTEVALTHSRGTVHAVYVRAHPSRTGRRAAILVGGNGQSLEDMVGEALFLLSRGIDVLSMQPSGFPAPDESYGQRQGERMISLASLMRRSAHTIEEETIMLDGTTAMQWLRRERRSDNGHWCDRAFDDGEVMVEGHSLGTLTAHTLARTHPGLAAVVVVEPFSSLGEAATYTALNEIANHLDAWMPRKQLLELLHAPVERAAHSVARLAFAPSAGSGVPAEVRGFDARSAVRGFRGAYCAIEAGTDEMMGLLYDANGTRPGSRNLARRLVGIAKRRPAGKTKLLAEPENWHGSGYNTRKLKKGYARFLASAGVGRRV